MVSEAFCFGHSRKNASPDVEQKPKGETRPSRNCYLAWACFKKCQIYGNLPQNGHITRPQFLTHIDLPGQARRQHLGQVGGVQRDRPGAQGPPGQVRQHRAAGHRGDHHRRGQVAAELGTFGIFKFFNNKK